MSTQEADHVVMVTCDMANFQLRIETPSLTVQPGQTVVWSITGVPEGWAPQLSPDLGQVLPFEIVESSTTEISARGAKAGFGSVTYRINLQFGSSVEIWNGGGALLFSEGATLVSEEATAASEEATLLEPAPVSNVAEQFVFEVSGIPAGTPTQLVVVPASHTIHDGDTVKWNFNLSCFPDENPSGCQLQVLFTQFTPDPGSEASPNLNFGPFETITTTDTTVVGSGNNDIKGIYNFQVVVINETDARINWTSTEDPSIDNRDGI